MVSRQVLSSPKVGKPAKGGQAVFATGGGWDIGDAPSTTCRASLALDSSTALWEVYSERAESGRWSTSSKADDGCILSRAKGVHGLLRGSALGESDITDHLFVCI